MPAYRGWFNVDRWEYSCHQCGATVDEGTPFCKHCRAPQIRVVSASTAAEAPALDGLAEVPASYPTYPGSNRVLWPQALTSAAISVLISTIPLTFLLGVSGLGMLISGFLCVLIYRRRTFHNQVKASAGAFLGAICGAIGAGVWLFSLAMEASVFHSAAKVHQELLEPLQQVLANYHWDEQLKGQMLEFYQTPAGLGVLLFSGAVTFLLFSSLGGVLGAYLLRSRKRP